MVQELAAQVGVDREGGGMELLSVHEDALHLPVRREILHRDRDLLFS